VLTARSSRVLSDGDRAAVDAVLAADPVQAAFVASRVRSAGLAEWRLGAQVWGYEPHGRVEALCYSGANLVPVGAGPAAARTFAARARWQGRICSSLVGPSAPVLDLWSQLEAAWGPAREVRAVQPLLATRRPAPVPPDPGVRRTRPDELDVLLPACVAMYTEEVGVSPVGGDSGRLYRQRVAELIRAGRSYARIEDGRVLFKAELGAVTPQACQVQGVWVDPALRGTGIGTAGMAALVADALRTVAPVVSLYVNDFNAGARRVYDRCGFTQVGTFASVLF